MEDFQKLINQQLVLPDTHLYNSFGMQLVAHKSSIEKKSVINGADELSVKRL